MGVATEEGQKIYSINKDIYSKYPNIVNAALNAHSLDTKNRVQSALNAGLEVTIHEEPVNVSGWSGAGFISIDPQTGSGAYTIDGGSQGGVAWLAGFAQGASVAASIGIIAIVGGTAIGTLGVVGGVLASIILAAIFFAIHMIVLELATRGMSDEELACYNGGFGAGGAITGVAIAVFSQILPLAVKVVSEGVSAIISAIYGIPGIFVGMELPSTDRPGCFK